MPDTRNTDTASFPDNRPTLEWDIIDRMRKAREVAGLSPIEIAERIGIHPNTVWGYESRRSRPRSKVILMKWAEVTGVPLHWLTTGEDRRQETRPVKLERRGKSAGRRDIRASSPFNRFRLA